MGCDSRPGTVLFRVYGAYVVDRARYRAVRADGILLLASSRWTASLLRDLSLDLVDTSIAALAKSLEGTDIFLSERDEFRDENSIWRRRRVQPDRRRSRL